MAARKKKRRKQASAPPAPIPTPEEIELDEACIREEKLRIDPPAVKVHDLRRHPLLAPEAGTGYQVDLTTSYAVTPREMERAIQYGFRYCPPKWTP